jgi:phage-related protein
MAHEITYKINILSNGLGTVTKIGVAAEKTTSNIKKLVSLSDSIAKVGFAFKAISGAMHRLSGAIDSAQKAYNAQMVAERQLEQVMRNTIGASDAEIQSIKELASAQQRLGVVGDEVQLAGAKELATYITKTDSLKKLIPTMNDMLAHQYGLNASQEQAVQIAQMVGKVLDGQTGALSRAGYRFSEAEEAILKFGNEEQRVALLSQIVTKYVGGVNAALAATPEGKLKQHANDMGDLKERLGGLIVTIKAALLPLQTNIAGTMDKIISFFEANRARLTEIVSTIARVAGSAFGRMITVFQWLYNVVSKIWPALLAIAAALALNNLYTRVSNGLRIIAIGVTNLLRVARAREGAETNKNTFALRANSIAKSANSIATNVAALSAIVFAGAIKVATGAVNGLSVAIYNIPIIGWIAAAIAAIVALFILLWNRCRTFREIVFGIWEVIKAVFHNIGVFFGRLWNHIIKPILVLWWDTTKLVFGAIWDVIKTVFKAIASAAQWLWGVTVSSFVWVRDAIVSTFSGVWAWLKSIGKAIGNFVCQWIVEPIKNAFGALWDFLKRIFSWIGGKLSLIFKPIVALWKKLFSTDGMKDLGEAYAEGAAAGGASYDRDHAKEKSEDSPFALPEAGDAGKTALPSFTDTGESAAAMASEGGKSVRNVVVNINKLVETITVSVTHLKESREQIKAQVSEALLTAVNDVNLAIN